MTAPERPAHERILIEGEWLVENVGQHTCGAGGEWPHEPGCGLVPLMPVAELDAQMRARSRFAARIVGETVHAYPPGRRLVELYAGDRYEYPTGRPAPRVPVAELLLTEEQAADLIKALGEPDPLELPERLRPRPESWPL